ncbi:uncharacterized protein LOC127510643 [Ctenopharyngodon idella]|uniref:uncharacterized protein LOC127510643 n=1 Tax=Ctenopharyngodon idella TaxID=7959 RepID=UPI00223008EF|nr:uncharacterized protein LOC127510643 [Ctenopharyngodon idella]
MASAGSKRPRDPSAQGLKVKFLINIPLKVNSEDDAQKRCRYLLDALSEGFKEEEMKFMKDKSGKEVLEDVAVVIGMNGKHSPELVQILKKLKTFRYDCKIKYAIITYTWGTGGTIAQDATEPPYQHIREHLKDDGATKTLVEELKGDDRSCLVYFSFVDSDTIRFNFIYSEYLQIVREELKKDSIPPTVMSTGYEFHSSSDYHIASWLDRMVRVTVAEVNPLFVYYPEPNFCVLVRDGLNTIKESFIQKGRRNMESPILINRVKTRANFKAVFSDGNPIIIAIPDRFTLSCQGLKTGQSMLDGMNLAKGANCHRVLTNYQTFNKAGPNESTKKQGITGKNRGFIIQLYNAKNEQELEQLSKKNPFTIDGNDATILVNAIREAREYKNFVLEFNEKLPGNN